MLDKLCDELKIASKRNPDLSVVELIDFVCNIRYPTRKQVIDRYRTVHITEDWKLTNSDILSALKQYNEKIR